MTQFSSNKSAPTAQKLRGGYYTPATLAEFLCDWAIRVGDENILEPSCGDGNFIIEAASRLTTGGRIVAVEIDQEEMGKAKRRAASWSDYITWIRSDFFECFPSLQSSEPFDVLIGNPPFIRFQHFEAAARERAFGLLRGFGYRPNGLANAWASFVQLGAELLRDGGRMAMVVPAELLQVQYAAELRARLPLLFDDLLIVGFEEIVFPEIQQEVVLLLGEGRSRSRTKPGRLHTLQLKNGRELLSKFASGIKVSHLPARHAHAEMKWTSLFLPDDEFSILNTTVTERALPRLGSYAQVDVGIVTGRNKFFVISSEQADEMNVNGYAVDVVGRTSALKSIRFTRNDIESYSKKYPSKLLNLRGVDRNDFSAGLNDYISAGEQNSVNDGYKCRIRNRWYDVPSIYKPDAFLFRQIHNAPLLVANQANATATDTIHRVRVNDGIDVNRLCAASVNSLTFAWAEVCGRSYGGGVLELEPREAEELPIPYEHATDLDQEYLDQKLRAGDLSKALDYTDVILLEHGLGLSKSEVRRIRDAWTMLKGRRQGRKASTELSVDLVA